MRQIYGIDLSKKKLDISFIDKNGFRQHKVIDNNLVRISRFIEHLPANSVLCAEHTGTPGNLLRFLAHISEVPVILVTGYEVKHGLGLIKGKSDKIDSDRIREYAERFNDKLEYAVFEGECLFELQELHSLRNQLVKQRKMLEAQCCGKESNPFNSITANRIAQRQITSLSEDIKDLENEMTAILLNDPALKEKLDLITSIKGIGLITATELIVKTRNFSKIKTARQAASYAGVCPFPNSSGQMVKKSKVSPMSDKSLKSLLYLCSSSAVNHNKEYKLYYQRKLMEGKPHFLIMNNVANKLLRTIFAVLKSQIPWDPGYICIDPRMREKIVD